MVIDGFVLAGGHGSRMGLDKARLAWRGQPMAVRVADTLRARCGRVALVRRGDDGLPWPGEEVVQEPAHAARHPLYGVAAALASARTDLVLVVPCDLPWLTPGALDALLPGPAVAACAGRVHPLVAVLPRAWAADALALARAGAPARRLADRLVPVELPASDLRNVNRPEDRPGVGPVRGLVDGLPWLGAAARLRVAKGEQRRLAAHGMLDVRYPAAPRTGEVG
ncbi:MAG: molybdopterin-guanine dinucleotide biosynthesis protein A [Myxococcota bacterium]